MEKSKKWCIGIVASLLLILILFATPIIVIDPFLQYHTPIFGLDSAFTRSTQAYINPGMAKNYNYNSVLIGSSVIENFHISQIDEEFHVHSVKLPFAGGSVMNYYMILETAYNSHNNIDTIFFSVDIFGLLYDAQTPRNTPVPEYLYNKNPFDDVSYILNKDVYYYVFQMLYENINNLTRDIDSAYNWEQHYDFSQERVLSLYNRSPQSDTELPKNYYYSSIDASVDKFSEFIIEHPETRYIVFFPPYSIIQWDDYIRLGQIDAVCEGYRYAMEKWLQYGNVEIYSFMNCPEIITDLNNYREMMHFSERINAYMISEMANGNNRITKENLNKKMEEFYNYIQNFDYSVYFD